MIRISTLRLQLKYVKAIIETPFDSFPSFLEDISRKSRGKSPTAPPDGNRSDTYFSLNHSEFCRKLEEKYGPRDSWIYIPRGERLRLFHDLCQHVDRLLFLRNVEYARLKAYQSTIVKARRLHQNLHRVRATHGDEALRNWGMNHLLGISPGRSLSPNKTSNDAARIKHQSFTNLVEPEPASSRLLDSKHEEQGGLVSAPSAERETRTEEPLVPVDENNIQNLVPVSVLHAAEINNFATWSCDGVFYERGSRLPRLLVAGTPTHFGVALIPWSLHNTYMNCTPTSENFHDVCAQIRQRTNFD